jgi:uncharacterized protein YjiS (DUF1127 family)
MLSKFFKKLIQIQEKRAAYWQLRSLSDKQLRDMGLTRGSIHEAVYGED